MNAKLKIYCIILAVTYFGIIIYSMFDGYKDFTLGFKQGIDSKISDSTNTTIFTYIDVKPTNGYYSFPDEGKNLLTDKPIKTEISSINIHYQDITPEVPMYLYILRDIILFAIFFLILGILYIPFAFFSIIKSVTKGRVMEYQVVRKANAIGWILVTYSVAETAFTYIESLIAKAQIKIEDYEIVYNFGFSHYALFILGMVTLILAEILRESLKIKEEQELTI